VRLIRQGIDGTLWSKLITPAGSQLPAAMRQLWLGDVPTQEALNTLLNPWLIERKPGGRHREQSSDNVLTGLLPALRF
jgi:hypothetical protein